MINKILAIFGAKENKPYKQKYKTPWEVPKEQRCEECAFYGTKKCANLNCFYGIMEKIQAAR